MPSADSIVPVERQWTFPVDFPTANTVRIRRPNGDFVVEGTKLNDPDGDSMPNLPFHRPYGAWHRPHGTFDGLRPSAVYELSSFASGRFNIYAGGVAEHVTFGSGVPVISVHVGELIS